MTQPGTSFADPGGGQQGGGDVSRNVQVNLGADVSGYTSQLAQAQQQTMTLGQSVVQLSHQLGDLGKNTGKQLFHFAAADAAGLTGAIADAAVYEKQLGTLRASSAVTGSSMADMKGQINDAFATFPVARAQIIQLTETISNLGIKQKSVGPMVQTFTKLGAATGEDPNALAASSLQLDRTMGHLDPDSVNKYANALLVVSKNEGVAASGVNEFANAIGPMAKAAGIGQAAVMGISAAFVKAGADGGLAANSFIKIITDISTLSATGSPELGKYSSFVGKNAADFQNQTTTEKATQVFSGVGKGGTPALKFMETLGYGPRETKAIQAVAQSGGLGQAIAETQGATGNGDKLDSASKAAFSGLSNSVDMVRNQFTELGDLVGGPLLGFVTGLTKGFGVLMGLTTSVVKMLGPLPAIFGALAAAVAPIAGLVIGHLGTIGTLALGRTLLGPRSAGRVALAAGRAAGTAVAGGMTTEAAMAASAVGQRVAAGGASLRFRVPYEYGMRNPTGGSFAAGGAGVRSAAGFVGRGLLGTATWVTQQNTNMYRDSYTATGDRSGNRPVPEGMRFRDQFRTGSIRGMAGATRDMVGTGIYATGSMFAATAGGGVRAASRAAAAAAAEPLTGRAASLAAAGVRGPGAAARAAAAAAGAVLPAAAAVGGVAAKGAGLLARGAGAVLGSPLTLIAGMVAAPLIGSLISAIKSGNAARADVSGSLTGAAKYDVALDKSSTNLARFGNSVQAAADKLAGFANTPIEQLGNVTPADVNATSGKDYKIADKALGTVITSAKAEAAAPGGDPDAVKKAVLGYLQSMATQNGPITGDTFSKYKQDVLHEVGPGGANQVSDIMNQFARDQGQSNPNGDTTGYGTLGRLANQTYTPGGGGLMNVGSLDTFKDITGTAVSGIRASTQGYGAEGTKSQVGQMLNLGAVATSGGENAGAKKEAFAGYMQEAFSVDPKEFTRQLDKVTKESAGPEDKYGGYANSKVPNAANLAAGIYTEKEAPALMAKAFLATEQGKQYRDTNNLTDADVIAQATNPGKLPPPEAADTTKQLKASGALGKYAGNNAAFLSASIGDKSNQPAAQFAAAADLAGEATKEAGGNMDQATANLNILTDAMGGASTATGALAAQAAAWNRQLSDLKTPQLSREGQLTKANERAAIDAKVADPTGNGQGTNPSDANVKTSQASTLAAGAEQENYRQFMIGQMVALKAADVAKKRGIEDYNISVANSNRDFGIQQDRALTAYNLQTSRTEEDFHISQARAAEDYNTSRLRAQEDFQLSSQRSLEDYQLTVDRQTADHIRDLKRQAMAAAQDIYDPFSRTQAKATTDAGTLIYNLAQQNADIEKQMAQIAELKKKGLSQGSIDMLKLTDSSQAQEVGALTMSLTQNPNMVGQINAQTDTRLKDTTKATQTPDSIAFRQQTEDYTQQMSRQALDFRKTQDRASIDYYKSASRAAQDFYKSAARASQDEIKTLQRGAADFKLTSENAIKDHATQLADQQKALKLQQDRAVEDLKTSFTQYTGDFNAIFEQLFNVATGSIGKNAGEAGQLVSQALAKVKLDNPWIDALAFATDPLTSGGRPYGGYVAPPDAPISGGKPYAYGGISMTAQNARVSEHGPELHLPLNSRGQDFMAGLIAKSLVQGVTTAFAAPANVATSTSNNNTISFDGADIKITTQDPNDMARQLAAKAKLARLTSPVRH